LSSRRTRRNAPGRCRAVVFGPSRDVALAPSGAKSCRPGLRGRRETPPRPRFADLDGSPLPIRQELDLAVVDQDQGVTKLANAKQHVARLDPFIDRGRTASSNRPKNHERHSVTSLRVALAVPDRRSGNPTSLGGPGVLADHRGMRASHGMVRLSSRMRSRSRWRLRLRP
jgi:hypothetical protein